MESVVGLVLDASAFVAIERSSASAAWPGALVGARDTPVVLPAVVYAELLVGVRMTDSLTRAAVPDLSVVVLRG